MPTKFLPWCLIIALFSLIVYLHMAMAKCVATEMLYILLIVFRKAPRVVVLSRKFSFYIS